MPKFLIGGPPLLALAAMSTVAFSSSAPAGEHALGGLIHACRSIGAADSDVMLKIAQTFPNGADTAMPPQPSLRALCAPRRDRVPSAASDRLDALAVPRGV